MDLLAVVVVAVLQMEVLQALELEELVILLIQAHLKEILEEQAA
jgi:hypothetical protein